MSDLIFFVSFLSPSSHLTFPLATARASYDKMLAAKHRQEMSQALVRRPTSRYDGDFSAPRRPASTQPYAHRRSPSESFQPPPPRYSPEEAAYQYQHRNDPSRRASMRKFPERRGTGGGGGDPLDPFSSDVFFGGKDPFDNMMRQFDSAFQDIDSQFDKMFSSDPFDRRASSGFDPRMLGSGGGGGGGGAFKAERMTSRHMSRTGEMKVAHQERKTMVYDQGSAGKVFISSERKVSI
jgi:hypothetical protein